MKSPFRGSGHFTFSVDRVVACALLPEVRSATVYVSPKLRVTATRRFQSLRAPAVDLVVTVGKPNYKQRAFLKRQKAATRFPIATPQVAHWPKKRQ